MITSWLQMSSISVWEACFLENNIVQFVIFKNTHTIHKDSVAFVCVTIRCLAFCTVTTWRPRETSSGYSRHFRRIYVPHCDGSASAASLSAAAARAVVEASGTTADGTDWVTSLCNRDLLHPLTLHIKRLVISRSRTKCWYSVLFGNVKGLIWSCVITFVSKQAVTER